MDTIQLGSFALLNKANKLDAWPIGTVCAKDSKIFIVDTNRLNPISWATVGYKLIADRAICFNMTWKTLDECGFIKGKEVMIDGMRFLCRIPYVADDSPDGPLGINEWQQLQDQEGDADKDIHWKKNFFWAQKPGLKGMKSRVLVGFSAPNYRNEVNIRTAHHDTGFRPVLEPVGRFLGCPYDILNKHVSIILPDGIIRGTLIEVSDYDLTVKMDDPSSPVSQWALRDVDGVVDIFREKIKFVFDLG